MEYFLLYLFTKLEALHWVAGVAIGLGFTALLAALLFSTIDETRFPMKSTPVKVAKWALILGFFVIAIVPTQKDVGIIVGGKMAIDIAKSEEVSTISKKIFAVVNKKLDEASK